MTDREILEKHINLDNSCLTESEKTQVRDMIYEIGTCPHIEIDIDVTDKTPFYYTLPCKRRRQKNPR